MSEANGGRYNGRERIENENHYLFEACIRYIAAYLGEDRNHDKAMSRCRCMDGHMAGPADRFSRMRSWTRGDGGEPLPKEKQENAKPNAEQADKATAGGKGAKEQAGKTRKVKDHFGEVEIPVKPQRVAALYLEDYVTALGVKPVVQWYHPNWGKQPGRSGMAGASGGT
ncbi:hypothetical protein QJ48_00605 [Paenibacillus sp. A3]|nr:hypothetical protein QJ48_00605 [Paenibacillus sp. A3]